MITMPMQSMDMVGSGGGGGDLYNSLLSQLQGRQSRGLPGNMQYLMQLLSMMPQGQGRPNYGPQTPREPAGQAAMDIYLSNPANKASYLAGNMGGAYHGQVGADYMNQSNFFGLLQKMLGVNPIQFGR